MRKGRSLPQGRPRARTAWRADLTDRGSPVNSEVFSLVSVAVAVIDWPTGTVLVAMKLLIEKVPLALVVTLVWPMKVSPVSRKLVMRAGAP